MSPNIKHDSPFPAMFTVNTLQQSPVFQEGLQHSWEAVKMGANYHHVCTGTTPFTLGSNV